MLEPVFSFQMGGMECVITGLMDEFHSFFQGRRFAREIFTLAAAVVSFSIALINVTPVGTTVSLYKPVFKKVKIRQVTFGVLLL